MRFTADDAFDCRGTEDAILLNPAAARKIIAEHGGSLEDYREDTGDRKDEVDAGDVLAWLGY